MVWGPVSVSLYFLPLSILVMLTFVLGLIGAAIFRGLRAAFAIVRADVEVAPKVVRPGEGMRVWARVVPRGNKRNVIVRATLSCTMFDHRPRQLHTNVHVLAPVFDKPYESTAFVQMPVYAL